MAQKATIYKVELSVSDMDRYYYEIHKLTVAKHLSANMSNQTISLRGGSVQQDFYKKQWQEIVKNWMVIPMTLVLLLIVQSAQVWGSEVFSISNIYSVSVTLAEGTEDG